MKIAYDPLKRALTMERRGLDFEDAIGVFDGTTVEAIDDRQDYGEVRVQSFGLLDGRMVTVIWTQRGDTRHIISMRKCNDREQKKYRRQLGS